MEIKFYSDNFGARFVHTDSGNQRRKIIVSRNNPIGNTRQDYYLKINETSVTIDNETMHELITALLLCEQEYRTGKENNYGESTGT